MPRDKGGHGRTGSKHKKAIGKFQAKKKEAAARPATRLSSPASTAAPATTEDEVEDPAATPSKAQKEPDQHETEIVTHKTHKRVRFAENLPRNDGLRWPPRPAHLHRVKGWGGDFEKSQPYKSDYTTSQTTYQTCPKRPR